MKTSTANAPVRVGKTARKAQGFPRLKRIDAGLKGLPDAMQQALQGLRNAQNRRPMNPPK